MSFDAPQQLQDDHRRQIAIDHAQRGCQICADYCYENNVYFEPYVPNTMPADATEADRARIDNILSGRNFDGERTGEGLSDDEIRALIEHHVTQAQKGKAMYSEHDALGARWQKILADREGTPEWDREQAIRRVQAAAGTDDDRGWMDPQ